MIDHLEKFRGCPGDGTLTIRGMTTGPDAEQIEAFERARWNQEGWQHHRAEYVKKLTGQAAGLTRRRVETFEWASAIASHFERAYEALGYARGEKLGGTRMAKQLAAQGLTTRKGTDPSKLKDGGKAWADALMMEADAGLIQELVLECRTLMSAQCLSADFASANLTRLESEYLALIAKAIEIGRQLRNDAYWSSERLLHEAKTAATAIAKSQRLQKPVTLAARERYWRDRPAPVRKVFENLLNDEAGPT